MLLVAIFSTQGGHRCYYRYIRVAIYIYLYNNIYCFINIGQFKSTLNSLRYNKSVALPVAK